MAIERMKLLGITGDSKELDKFLGNILFKSDIQLEDAKKIYNKGWKLEYFEYDYKIKENLKKCENLLNKLEIQFNEEGSIGEVNDEINNISEKIEKINIEYDKNLNLIEQNEKNNVDTNEKIKKVSKISTIDIDMKKIYELEYVKFRYGSIPKKNLEDLKKEIKKLNTIMFEICEEQDIVWIIYFTTARLVSNIDGIFNIQKFEREMLPDDLLETPENYIKKLTEQIKQRNLEINSAKQKINDMKKDYEPILLNLYRQLQTYDKINTIKKYIVHDQNGTFYVVAWVPMGNLKKMESELKKWKNIDYIIRDGDAPPTKLKNTKLISPFEALVKMYGMPKINEIDPTCFVAITTFIMFGFMFGDVGHGLIFAILGIILKIKKKSYSTIVLAGGISSIIFGFLYGSVFGKEEIIKSIIISPINNINTMLLYGIVVGTVFILMAMILNIINGIKNKDMKKVFFSENRTGWNLIILIYINMCRIFCFI